MNSIGGRDIVQDDRQDEQEAVNLHENTDDMKQEDEALALLHYQLAAEQHKAEEYLDLLRRTQANLVNYRRKMSLEQVELRKETRRDTLYHLLPVLDDLRRTLAEAPPDLITHTWVQGIVLLRRRLVAILDQQGVRHIGQPGDQFDPRCHEAVAKEERSDISEGTILRVELPGFTIEDLIIRPAQVVIAQAPNQMREVPLL